MNELRLYLYSFSRTYTLFTYAKKLKQILRHTLYADHQHKKKEVTSHEHWIVWTAVCSLSYTLADGAATLGIAKKRPSSPPRIYTHFDFMRGEKQESDGFSDSLIFSTGRYQCLEYDHHYLPSRKQTPSWLL